jgi:predicted nucleotidyltransferase
MTCYKALVAPDTAPPLTRAVQLLERRLHPAAIVLFGSRAGGRPRQDSDFDLGALCGRPLPDAFTVAGLKTDLEDLLGGSVDLVVLDSASPILAMEVLRSHRVLAMRDPEAFETFTVRTLMAYFDLKRVREPIERAILAREANS